LVVRGAQDAVQFLDRFYSDVFIGGQEDMARGHPGTRLHESARRRSTLFRVIVALKEDFIASITID